MPDVTANRSFADQWLAYTNAVAQYTNTLQFKLQWLKQHKSNDPIVQTQTEAIVALAEVVHQIQLALAPLPGVLIPDTSGPRAAASPPSSTSMLSAAAILRRP